MALSYTSVNRIYDVEPMIGSVSTLTSAQIMSAFAEPAEAEINAALARNYVVPVPGVVPLLLAIADDIAVYRIMSRRIFNQKQLENSPWPDRFKESRAFLRGIAEGKELLVDSGGTIIATRTDVAKVKSNVSGYSPTFHEGNPVDWVQDPDKIDDLLRDRDLL